MSKKFRRPRRSTSIPQPMIEKLEERLLLTTLKAGDFFVYQNSQKESVRIDLTDSTGTSEIQLFAYDDISFSGLTDLPGLYNGMTNIQPGPGQDGQVLWSEGAGLPIFDAGITGSGAYRWAPYVANPAATYPLDARGADTEIYAIYVTECDPSTYITIQTLSSPPRTTGTPVWYATFDAYNSGKLPVIGLIGTTPIHSPAGSGGVIVGAYRFPIQNNPTHHIVVHTTDNLVSAIAQSSTPPGTAFYTVHAGLTVSPEITEAYPTIFLGPNIQSLASNGTAFFSANASPFIASVVPTAAGKVGIDLRSLADNSSGTTLSVENAPIGFNVGTALGTNVNAIAADGLGNMYFVDQANNSLYSIDSAGTVKLIAQVVDAVNGAITYSNITSMDFYGGELYAVATSGSPATSKLITIDPLTAKATVKTAVANNMSSIAFDAAGALYGVNATNNHLVSINTTNGNLTDHGQLRVGTTNLTVTGIAFIYAPGAATGKLYATTDADVYTVDTTTALCTIYANTGLTGITGLTYNFSPAFDGVLWASTQSGLAEISLGGTLLKLNKTTGAVTARVPLVDSANATFVYKVDAMDFIGNTLYATATVVDLDDTDAVNAPAGQVLVTIDPVTGSVTAVAPVTAGGNPLTLSAIAFSDTTGLLYGASASANNLYEINAFTGVATSLGFLPASGFTGLQFVLTANSDGLYGVTGSDLYNINIANPALSVRLGATGQTTLTSLAFDQHIPGMLWATTSNGTTSQLVQIPLAPTMLSTDLSTVSRVGLLIDSQNPSLAYTDIRDWAFDSSGTLWAVGSIYSMAPVDVPTPSISGPFLLTIDVATGLVTRVAPTPLATTGITSIAFDNTGALFGFDSSTNEIDRINTANGQMTVVTQTDISGVTGIAFDVSTNTLFAITDTTIYTIDLTTGHATLVGVPGQTGISSLSRDPNDPANLFFTAPVNGIYTIFSLSSDVASVKRTLGGFIVGGTLAGWTENAIGNINVIEAGFLYGKITIAENNDAIIMHQGGGLIHTGNANDPLWYPVNQSGDADSWIRIGGTTGGIYSDAGILATYVSVDANPNASPRSDILNGFTLMNLIGTKNVSKANAQMLVGSQDEYYLFGLPYTDPVSKKTFDDWFAMPMIAGQTVSIEAGLGWDTYLDNLGTFYNFYRLELQDSSGRILEVIGNHSVEDYGVWSIGTHQRNITFTAMSADVYYVHVWGVSPFSATAKTGPYTLHVTDGPAAALGGIRDGGDYSGEVPVFADNISVNNGGNIGAIIVGGDLAVPVTAGGVTTFYPVVIRTYGGGNIYAVEGGQIRYGFIMSEGWIGEIESTTGLLNAFADAGYGPGALLGQYNNNAFIQNITSATDMYGVYNATGSMGVIEVGGNMGGSNLVPIMYCEFHVNTDGNGLLGGPVGSIDLINVAGNWGSLFQVPTLTHGAGGNIGFVHVGGNVFVDWGGGRLPIVPTVVTDGSSSTLYDDGGGQLIIDPDPMVDPVTGQVIIDPVTGLPVFPTYSYAYIGVDDASYAGVGAGGAVFNLTINGSASLRATGRMEIGDLDLTGFATGGSLVLGGSGQTDVFYVHSNQPVTMRTNGSIISGAIVGDVNMTVTGNVGFTLGRVGAWLPGLDVAPTAPNIATEPQFGWFHGTINGLDITGNVTNLSVGGYLVDLRVHNGGITKVTVNSDDVTTPSGWDGVLGVVWSQNRFEFIDVGDGLKDDGTAPVARTGIFGTASIGKVLVDGPRYVIDGVIFNELNGIIVAGHDEIVALPDPLIPGATVLTLVDAIGQVIGLNGAWLTGIVGSGDLDMFQPDFPHMFAGTIGLVSFSGPGSGIFGAGIEGSEVETVSTSADSDGMSNTYISATFAPADGPGIGTVSVGGPGMHDSHLSVNGGSIGTVKGDGPAADMWSNFFVSTDGMLSFSGRRLFNNNVHMPGKVGTMASTQETSDNMIVVGSIGKLTTGGNFARNQLTIAGELTSATIGGSFIHSSLILQGSATAYLKSLVVNGDISGVITSGSKIGQIVSLGGQIWADIATLPSGLAPNVDLIQAALGFTGNLKVAGNVNRFVINSSLGANPATNGGFTQRFEVGGSLNNLRIASGNGTSGDLFADFSVGGNVGTMDIDGTLYGVVCVNGSVNKLTLDGGLGGFLDFNGDGIAETPRGKLSVMGTINNIKLPTSRDIVADMSVGGTIKGITLNGGSILGNLESRFGKFGTISVTNGSIAGNLSATAFDKITVTGGNITGDITAANGAIKSLTVKNGTIDGNIQAANGTIDSLSLVNASALAGNTIRATQGFGKVSVRGTLSADLISGRGVKSFALSGGDLSGHFTTVGDIMGMKVGGRLFNGTIRSGGKIGSLSLGGMVNAIVSSSESIDKMTVAGNVDNSKILAGLDIGADNVVGGTDDALGDGSVRSLKIGGLLKDSIISAGVSGGTDGDLTTLDNNGLAPGISTIDSVTVGGLSGVNTVLAETAINATFASAVLASGGVVRAWTPTATIVAPFGQDVFGPAVGKGAVPFVFPGDLVLSLSGAGVAKYDGAGHLTFEGTNSKSKLVLQYTGTGAYFQPISITGGDDASIGTIQVISNVILGNVNVDGTVGMIVANGVNPGSVWNLPAGAASVTISSPQDVDITAGDIGKLTMGSAFNGGTLTAESVTAMTIVGDSNSAFDIESGGTLSIAGNFSGTLVSVGAINALTVSGAMSGTVNVLAGDIVKMTLGSMSGRLNAGVQIAPDSGGNPFTFGGGKIGTAVIVGDFGGIVERTSLRTSTGITKLTIGGNFSGLLSTPGVIGALTAGGIMSGRAWSGAGITKANFGSMSGGLLTSSGDIVTTKIAGGMSNGLILAGFNPGDAGFDAVNGEVGNIQTDAATLLANRSAANTDSLSGGNIKLVQIGGDMTASSVAAGVGPGVDGFLGTGDDHVYGIGAVTRVVAGGNIVGTAVWTQSFGVYAASNLPAVFHHWTQPFISSGNVHVSSMISAAGALTVTDVIISNNKITVFLNHAADYSTVKASAIRLLASVDSTFGAGDQDVTSHVTVTYDAVNCAIVLTLKAPTANWAGLGAGNYFQVTVNDTVSDSRGNRLDGNYHQVFPTGDGAPGGNFVYNFQIGNVTIAGVPSYIWWFGCAPTAAGMLVGYYDTKAGMDDLIAGDASTQTTAVNEVIASSGTTSTGAPAVYTSDGNGVGTIDAGMPGTGNIPDYALYDGVDDMGWYTPYPDMSDLNPTGVHADNSIADFMHTARSVDESGMGGTPVGSTGDIASHEAAGVEGYFGYKGHTAVATDQVWAEMTWSEYVGEINAGRPVLLGVDASGDGYGDHMICAIGYNQEARQYAYFDTWDNSVHWANWAPATSGQPFGIQAAIFVTASA